MNEVNRTGDVQLVLLTYYMQLSHQSFSMCSVSYEQSDDSTPEFEIKCDAKLLQPGESKVANCYFLPSKSRAYSRKVAFKINGNYYKFATLRGRGTAVKVFNIGCTSGVLRMLLTVESSSCLQIELVNPEDKVLNFGAVQVNDVVSRQAKLVNLSLLPAMFSVLVTPSSKSLLLVKGSILGVSLVRKVGKGHEVVVESGKQMQLQPKEECRIQVTFSPSCRVPKFAEKVCDCAHVFHRITQ